MPSGKYEYTIIEMIENANRTSRAQGLLLGGRAATSGGSGVGPPGGFIGYLPQSRVNYDLTEAASNYTPASGMSIVDNLNHIRYRLQNLEAGSGVVVSGGSGDMSKSVYDTDDDGVVDNSEGLEGHNAAYFQTALGFTPENVANKDATTTLGISDTKYPTQKAVKTYVDAAVSGISISGGSGDMLKSVYDTDDDGAVNDSENLNGHPDTYFQTVSAMSGYMQKSIYDSDNDGVVDNAEALNNHADTYFQVALGFTAEDVSNKDTTTTLGTSDTKYPSQKAVKTYVDTAISGIAVSSGSGGHTIKDSTTSFTQRTGLKFLGTGVVVTDDAGGNNTVVTISGGSGITSSGLGYASIVEDFAGNSSTTHFLTAHTMASGTLGVYLNGIRQEPNVDYTVDVDYLGFTTLFTAVSGEVILANYDYTVAVGTEVVLSGYMQKSVYDSDNDGKIEQSQIAHIYGGGGRSLIPLMFDSSWLGFTASDSEHYSTAPAWKAFVYAGVSANYNGWITNASALPQWIQIQCPTAVTAVSYAIMPWWYDNYPSRTPKTWKLQGSNNGSSYTDLDSQTNFTAWPSSINMVMFTITSPAAYTYYRLYITANQGNAYTGIGFMQLYAAS